MRCHRCRGRKGRMLAPRARGRWLTPRQHRYNPSNRLEWVECDLCHGEGNLEYPIGDKR